MAVLRKLRLLMWKNVQIRKHNKILTAGELLGPIGLIIAYVAFYLYLIKGTYDRIQEYGSPDVSLYTQTEGDIEMEDLPITSRNIKCYDRDGRYLHLQGSCRIAYTLPKKTQSMQNLNTDLMLQKLIDASEDRVEWKLYSNVEEIEKQILFDRLSDKRRRRQLNMYGKFDELTSVQREQAEWNDTEFAVIFEKLELNNVVYTIRPNNDGFLKLCGERERTGGFFRERNPLEEIVALTALQWNIDKILIETFAKEKPNKNNKIEKLKANCGYHERDYNYTNSSKLDIERDHENDEKRRAEKKKNDETYLQIQIRLIRQNSLIFLGIAIAISYVVYVFTINKLIITERDSGVKELMKLFGLSNWMHWTCFLINFIIIPLFCSIIMAAVLCINFTGLNNGAMLANNDYITVLIIFVLYSIASVAFCFFITTISVKYFIGLIIGFTIWLLSAIAYGGVVLGESKNQTLPFEAKMGLALFPNLALSFSFEVFKNLAANELGPKLTTLTQATSDPGVLSERIKFNGVQNELALWHMIVMFIVDIVLYFALTIYFDAIIPNEFTVAKPFYFIFDPRTYGITFKKKKNLLEPLTIESNYGPNFEPEPEGLNVGVEIRNLRKVFGFRRGKVAVDGISLKMYEGQIFTLLGHNGAGKTTTISCCIGMTSPTSGTAIINGFDIRNQMDQVRQNLGVCNQHNVLFDDLTVDEHLIFFGQLKGVSGKAAEEERTALLQRLQLSDRAKIMAKKLSGGQKRKLSLGLALIGKAKVVFLDEPTSGMDVEARRGIWDLLQFERTNRTIILTTHFMEEAEILGDRIGIMSHGRLQCCGTPTFLKTYYGEGYRLIVTTTEDSADIKEVILKIVQSHIPTAFIEPAVMSINGAPEFTISVPKDDFSKSILPAMFKSLNSKKEQYNIVSFEFTQSTLDDVFVKAAELQVMHRPAPITFPASEVTSMITGTESGVTFTTTATELTDNEAFTEFSSETEGSIEAKVKKDELKIAQSTKQLRVKGIRLVCQQFLALLLKRILYTCKKFGILIIPILIYLAILIGTVVFYLRKNGHEFPVEPELQNLQLTYAKETNVNFDKKYKVLYSLEGADDKLKEAFSASTSLVSTFEHKPSREPDPFINKITNGFHVLVKLNSKSMNVFWSPYESNYGPLAVNIMSNTLLKYMTKNDNAKITTKVQPLSLLKETVKNLSNYRHEVIQKNSEIQHMSLVMTVLGYGFLMYVVMFVIPPVEERICQAKQLQLMTGVNPMIYWGAAYLWDLFLFSIIAIIAVVTLKLSEKGEEYSRNGGLIMYFFILMAFGSAFMPFMYLISLISKSAINALAFMLRICFGFDFACVGLRIAELSPLTNNPSPQYWCFSLVKFIPRLSPFFSLQVMNKSFFQLAFLNEAYSDNRMSPEIKKFMCFNDPEYEYPIYRNLNDCEQISYLSWSYTTPFIISRFALSVRDDRSVITPGIGQELLYTIIYGIFYSTLLYLIEVGMIAKWKNKWSKKALTRFQSTPTEEDVQAEEERVHELVSKRRTNEDAIVIADLCKSYGGFSAVANLSIGVHHGECFGLLGVNGAGKTTTFRILTGDEARSFGEAYASNLRLTVERKRFLSKFGYCPQFDGIIGVLTGLQMIQLFARLRGVKNANAASKALMEHVGLTESRNIQCRKYSGGMKRRLSAAMGVIGDPEILLLDEPTTGVDPLSRREFWKIIQQAKAGGRSIILTSHSMDEIEACCSRLGIMVNGQLQCIGSCQQLKNKFAQGYRLTINWKPNAMTENFEKVIEMEQGILKRFEPCIIKDKHQMQVQYHIQNPDLSYDFLFETMEKLVNDFPDVVENYDITKTSLEEIFLSFAKAQYAPRKVANSKGGGFSSWFSSSKKNPPQVAPNPNVMGYCPDYGFNPNATGYPPNPDPNALSIAPAPNQKAMTAAPSP